MPTSALALVAGVIVVLVVDAALFGVLIMPTLARRFRRARAASVVPEITAEELAILDAGSPSADGVPAAMYHRVVRLAAWAYILFTAVFVGVTHLWPDRQPAIYGVLAVAGALVFLVHDLMPAGRFRRAKYFVEGLIAVGLVTAIVLLTNGARSPFFFAYPVVVAGAALVASPAVTFAMAALATAAYLLAAGTNPTGPIENTTIAIAGINVAALVLLTYVAYVVTREQRRIRAAAIRLSTTDALTGLANRAYLLAALEREIDRGVRYERGFCLLMADLDGLKTINDTHGHAAGDVALRRVADVIRDGVRTVDVPARLAGDEFVVLLPETDPTGAYVVAEKIRQSVAEVRLADRGVGIALSVSIGIVAWPEDGHNAEEVMRAVDSAMYASKRRGKNRIAAPGSHGPGPDDPPRPRGDRADRERERDRDRDRDRADRDRADFARREYDRHDVASRREGNVVPLRGTRPGPYAPRTNRTPDRTGEPPLAAGATRFGRGRRGGPAAHP